MPRFWGGLLLEATDIQFLEGKKSVSLRINPASRIRITGTSGSGKSTLLKILAGLKQPLAGKLNRQQNIRQGYVPQEMPPLYLPSMRVFIKEIMSYSAHKNNMQEIHRLFQNEMEFWQLQESLLDSRLDSLSGGEKQRFLISIALSLDPQILFLDEPTSALPAKLKQKVCDRICSLTIPFILVSHDLVWNNCMLEEISLGE